MDNDLIKALRRIASDTPNDTCYEDYYNLTHSGRKKMHCSGALDDSIPCPYYQNTYPACFSDGDCGEWLNKVADILEKYREVSRFFEMEIEQANERMELLYDPMFNGVEVGNYKRIELNKAHVRFCEQILKMMGSD